MMHGTDYAGQNPTGWIATEKFDGLFARWDGDSLLTRNGVNYNAPTWFTVGLPVIALDCELFAGYGKRKSLNSASRWRDENRWRDLQLIIFDSPAIGGAYKSRHEVLTAALSSFYFFRVCSMWFCAGQSDLITDVQDTVKRGGEGLMIRHPDSAYTVGKVETMLKVKPKFLQDW